MNRFLVGLIIVASLSCYVTGEDAPTTALWSYDNPSNHKLDESVLRRIHIGIEEGNYENIRSLQIYKNQNMVFEKSYDGNSLSDLNPIQDRTLITSLIALGILWDNNLIGSLEDPLEMYLPSYLQVFEQDTLKKQITIQDLLTHRTGLSWNESIYAFQSNESDIQQMKRYGDWVAYILEKPLEAIPGTRYSYHSGMGLIIGEMVKSITSQPMDEFLSQQLFTPLDIKQTDWTTDPTGHIDGSFGLSISQNDIMKIAIMIKNGGIWNNSQILSKNWLSESSSLKIQVNERYGHGFVWWLLTGEDYERIDQYEMFYFTDYLGGGLFFFPNEDMIVSISATNFQRSGLWNYSVSLISAISRSKTQ
ncbi:MAG: serine hydrolase [Cyclobacteriaceae bacterium]